MKEVYQDDKWTEAIRAKYKKKTKSQIIPCSCGRKYIRTRGASQTKCIFCIKSPARRI